MFRLALSIRSYGRQHYFASAKLGAKQDKAPAEINYCATMPGHMSVVERARRAR